MKFLFHSCFAHVVLDPAEKRTSGGAELQIALLSRELVKRGHECVIAAGDCGQPDGYVIEGVKIRNAGKFQTGALGDALGAIAPTLKILREERPDYVGLLGWTTWLYFFHVLKPLFGYQLLFICSLDTEVNGEYRRAHPIKGALFETAMARCEMRYAMSEDQRAHYRRRGESCGFYRNLILGRKEPLTAAKEVDFLWVARCQEIKRPWIFLDLAEQLPERSFEMICPNENAVLWEKMRTRAEKLPNVKFIESVPYHQIQTHYDRARIFVNTSTYEGWPNSFIQSGLARTAILSLDVNPEDLIRNYRLGCFAEGSVEKLVEYARAMAADEEALRGMQHNAERFVKELHDNDRNVDLFLEGLPR